MKIWHAKWKKQIQVGQRMRTCYRQKGNSGLPANSLRVYGYRKDPENKNHWLIDEEAEAIVKRIFRLAIDCHGSYEIARILSEDKVECPAYYNAVHENCMKRSNIGMSKPYAWDGATVINILRQPGYMGHTVNFRSSERQEMFYPMLLLLCTMKIVEPPSY